MTVPGKPEVAGRLQRALEAFQKANVLLLTAHRNLKGLTPKEAEHFWMGAGARLEVHLNMAATEVVSAFKTFSAAGLVAGANDRHLVSEAQRHITEGSR